MEWPSSVSVFDPSSGDSSFDIIQRFFADNPAGSIGSKLFTPRPTITDNHRNHHSATSAFNPTDEKAYLLALKMSKASQQLPLHQSSSSTNPSPPESSPSPCSSFNGPNSFHHHQHQASDLPNNATTHPKRKPSPGSALSGPLKDRKESSAHQHESQHSPGHSATTTVEHTHDSSELLSDTPDSKGRAKDKRKEQNRNAQRAFRERKEKRLHELQEQVDALLAKQEPLVTENQHLKELVNQLQTENQTLGVYKQAFTFTLSNDLQRASMPIAKAFDVDPNSSTSTSPPKTSSSALATSLHEYMAAAKQQDLPVELPQPPSEAAPKAQPENPDPLRPAPLRPMHRPGQTQATDGLTPPLSAGSSLGGLLSNTPAEYRDRLGSHASSESAHGYLYSQPAPVLPNPHLDKNIALPAYWALGSTFTSSPDLPNPVAQAPASDHVLYKPKLVTQVSSAPLLPYVDDGKSTANTRSPLGLASDAPRASYSNDPNEMWNAFLSYDPADPILPLGLFSHPSGPRHSPLQSEANLASNSSSFLPQGSREFGTASSMPFVLPTVSSNNFSSPTLATLPTNSFASEKWYEQPRTEPFTQWRSNAEQAIEPLYQHKNDVGATTTSAAVAPESDLTRNKDSFKKFVDEGVLSSEELDGLCSMLKSKATCQERKQFMSGVAAVRPDWEPLITDIRQRARAAKAQRAGPRQATCQS